jgi:hypothetical protein
MDYLFWSDQIAATFFNAERAGCQVKLHVTEALIREIGAPYSASLADFIAAVQKGPAWVTESRLCLKARQCWQGWRTRALPYPPYLGYLALFALAAGREGDFSPSAYYPRLRALLGESPVSGTYPHFDLMLDLWDDLERWANLDQQGQLGLFTADIAGNRIHVGLPIAQTILTEEERHALPLIFSEAGFDPLALPNSQTLAARLLFFGRSRLKPRTLNTLKISQHKFSEECAWLLNVITEELRDWDGQVGDSTNVDGRAARFVGALCLCLELDRTASRVAVTLRCRSSRDFPAEGFVLQSKASEFTCEESALGWSTTLFSSTEGTEFDASRCNWAEGWRLLDAEQQWSFNLPASPVRIFVSGSRAGLPGLVECQQLPLGTAFYLAARQEYCELLASWGSAGCRGFKEINIRHGLPTGWRFFEVESVQNDELVLEQLPLLALPRTLRLELEGGLRISQGNRFFRFAPPAVRVIGGPLADPPTCNGIRLLGTATPGLYTLPPEALAQSDLLIAAPGNEATRRLFLADDEFQTALLPRASFGRFGELLADLADGSPYLSGAALSSFAAPAFAFHTLAEVQGERRVFFIGRQPGQIVTCPAEPLPEDWQPVWAVPLRQQGKAIFCGTNLTTAAPLPVAGGDRKKLRLWKEVLWHCRKRITPPAHKDLSGLWRKFQQEAQRVER